MAPKKPSGRQQPYRQGRPDQGAREHIGRADGAAKRSVGDFTSDWQDDYDSPVNPLAGITFTLDRVTFECLGEMDLLDKSELSMLAMSSMDVRSPSAVGIVAQFLQLAFGPAEYLRFKSHVRAMKTPDDAVLKILASISDLVTADVQEVTGRPTGPRSRSSAGRSATDERVSRVISLQGGDVQIVDPVDPRLATG